MEVKDVLDYLKSNIRKLIIEEDFNTEGIYYGSVFLVNYEVKLQIEFLDDTNEFYSLTYWMVDEEGHDVSSEYVIFNLDDIENVVDFVKTAPKIYAKIENTLEALIELAEEYEINIEYLLQKKL